MITTLSRTWFGLNCPNEKTAREKRRKTKKGAAARAAAPLRSDAFAADYRGIDGRELGKRAAHIGKALCREGIVGRVRLEQGGTSFVGRGNEI